MHELVRFVNWRGLFIGSVCFAPTRALVLQITYRYTFSCVVVSNIANLYTNARIGAVCLLAWFVLHQLVRWCYQLPIATSFRALLLVILLISTPMHELVRFVYWFGLFIGVVCFAPTRALVLPITYRYIVSCVVVSNIANLYTNLCVGAVRLLCGLFCTNSCVGATNYLPLYRFLHCC